MTGTTTRAGTGRFHHLLDRGDSAKIDRTAHRLLADPRTVAERTAVFTLEGEATGRSDDGSGSVHGKNQSPPASPMCWAR